MGGEGSGKKMYFFLRRCASCFFCLAKRFAWCIFFVRLFAWPRVMAEVYSLCMAEAFSKKKIKEAYNPPKNGVFRTVSGHACSKI